VAQTRSLAPRARQSRAPLRGMEPRPNTTPLRGAGAQRAALRLMRGTRVRVLAGQGSHGSTRFLCACGRLSDRACAAWRRWLPRAEPCTWPCREALEARRGDEDERKPSKVRLPLLVAWGCPPLLVSGRAGRAAACGPQFLSTAQSFWRACLPCLPPPICPRAARRGSARPEGAAGARQRPRVTPCALARQPEVEVEYVSAPREYEELLGTSGGADAMDTDGPPGGDGPAPRGGLGAGAGAGGGLGFVPAGASADGAGGAGLGLGFTPGLGAGGATPGLGAGGATPGLGLGSDWGGETPGGAGLGLGATPRLGADADAGAPSASAVRPLVGPITGKGGP